MASVVALIVGGAFVITAIQYTGGESAARNVCPALERHRALPPTLPGVESRLRSVPALELRGCLNKTQTRFVCV